MKVDDIVKFEKLITNVNWSRTSDEERLNFVKSLSYMEQASTLNTAAESVRKGRLSSMIITLLTTAILMLAQVDPAVVVGIASLTQLALYLLSQFVESKTSQIVEESQKSTFDMLQMLAWKHPND